MTHRTARILTVLALVALLVVLAFVLARDDAPTRNAVSGVTGSVDASRPVAP